MQRLSDGMKHGKNAGGADSYDITRYDNRGRAWITALMLNPHIGINPQDEQGNSLITQRKVCDWVSCRRLHKHVTNYF